MRDPGIGEAVFKCHHCGEDYVSACGSTSAGPIEEHDCTPRRRHHETIRGATLEEVQKWTDGDGHDEEDG